MNTAVCRPSKLPSDERPKPSDHGVWLGTCRVDGKAAAEAGAVTQGAVRCSVWLGAEFRFDFMDIGNLIVVRTTLLNRR
jgi:hypothetical protein